MNQMSITSGQIVPLKIVFEYDVKTHNIVHWNMCTYIDETGRRFQTRLNEHKKETDKVSNSKGNFTRQTSVTEQSKSAIADHAVQQNHGINWKDAQVLQKEYDTGARHIKESHKKVSQHHEQRRGGTLSQSNI